MRLSPVMRCASRCPSSIRAGSLRSLPFLPSDKERKIWQTMHNAQRETMSDSDSFVSADCEDIPSTNGRRAAAVISPVAVVPGEGLGTEIPDRNRSSFAPPFSSVAGTTSEVVELDVGGCKFSTSRSTLCRVPGSHLAANVLRPSWCCCVPVFGWILFIDRDGR